MRNLILFIMSMVPSLGLAQNIAVDGEGTGFPVGLAGAVELEFLTEVGVWYQVEISRDLELWDNEGYAIKGTGGLVSTLASTRQYDTAYYRVLSGGDPENVAPWPVYTAEAPLNIDEQYQIGINQATAGYILKSTGSGWVAGPPAATPVSSPSNMQPYQGINFIMALVGVYPSRNTLEPFIGQVIMFGGNFAPRGWALCDGQLLSIASNQALFSILGTTYGGDGRTTFGLPDLRGRVPLHPGRGSGLTPRNLGQMGGAETVPHSH